MSNGVGMIIPMFTSFLTIGKALQTEELWTFDTLDVWLGDGRCAGEAFLFEDRTVSWLRRFVMSNSVFGEGSGRNCDHWLV